MVEGYIELRKRIDVGKIEVKITAIEKGKPSICEEIGEEPQSQPI